MHLRKLGSSDIMMPAIGLGTWSVFDTDNDREWLAAEALAAGVNLFDSSPMYGQAEDSLARALGNRRPESIIATKVSALDAETGDAQIAHSLSLFGTIDLLQIHNIVSWQLHLPRLERMKNEGTIKAIGASQGLLVSDDAFEEIMRTGMLDSIQIRYNPKRQEAADRILPFAQDMGIGVLIMQPLRWGVLLASPTAQELDELGADSWGAAVLRWILSNPCVTTVLTTTATPGRITANASVGAMPPYVPEQMDLVQTILVRGHSTGTDGARRTADEIVHAVKVFLTARLGACFCDICIAREFASTVAEAAIVRQSLPVEHFASEQGPCLGCGNTGPVARSRTIMR